ncbi:secreted salivary gland peptide, putative [Ixodes scapularis]|uniref:Secreted salivary gland peptide, putative n=2 Tax=Ixodes scapularis TaxID=6945 RepID=B7PBF3_IXOSC|nr:secreted salivary gland peptide, putative [Ixodes scapularis]|eukprot:XP_002408006.1 secreted salivary gland peptide, putative [Ixodes scapularis]
MGLGQECTRLHSNYIGYIKCRCFSLLATLRISYWKARHSCISYCCFLPGWTETMNTALILLPLAALLAIAESSVLRRRELSEEEQFVNLIQTTCIDPLNLTEEESAAVEKLMDMDDDDMTMESAEDLERLIEQVAPNEAVANSLKPKVATVIACVAGELLKILGLQR